MRDCWKRSVVKSITWRLLGIAILLPLAYLFTQKWEEATLITLTFHAIRTVLYIFHERAWERVKWGRNDD